jgi:hypothetical protein
VEELSFDQLEDRVQEIYDELTTNMELNPEECHALVRENARLDNEIDRRYNTWPIATLMDVYATSQNRHLRASFRGELMERRITPIFEGFLQHQQVEDARAMIALFPPLLRTWYGHTRAEYEQRLREAWDPERDLAMMMASQRRLGSDSDLGQLAPELLHLISKY